MTTITNGTDTYLLPEGLEIYPSRPSAACCSDCGRWADLGERIRHSSRCDTETLQAVLDAPAARPTITTTKRGQTVVKGLVADVYEGATLVIDGRSLTIASTGRPWTSGPHTLVYGYLTTTYTHTSRCDECGYTSGHRMDCALA